MDIEKEFDRVTAPPSSASSVRRLKKEEIEHLERAGMITPIHLMRKNSWLPRVHVPGNSCRGTYDR